MFHCLKQKLVMERWNVPFIKLRIIKYNIGCYEKCLFVIYMSFCLK